MENLTVTETLEENFDDCFEYNFFKKEKRRIRRTNAYIYEKAFYGCKNAPTRRNKLKFYNSCMNWAYNHVYY